MRIAIVAARYPPDLGGMETVIGELAPRLSAAGDDVEVFAHASESAPAGSAFRGPILVHRFRVPLPARHLTFAPGLLRALRHARGRFDVVHAHNYHASPAMSAALAGSRPLVFTPYYHGSGHTRLTRIAHLPYRPLSRTVFSAAARIVCISHSEARNLITDMPFIRTPVSVLPMGVDTGAITAAAPFEGSRDVVLAVGRMDPYKQLDRIVLASRSLPDRFRVVIVGDGPARAQLERLIARHALGSRVELLGRIPADDLLRWYRSARVLVSMSLRESFGLTLVEALAAGSAVVASDIPAHRDTAEAQPVGAVRLVEPGIAPPDLAGAIVAAADAGPPAGVAVSSWDDVAEHLRAIYRSVAAS
jgi:glycosyltransferase involved in cell wall biosynthesis